MFITISISTLSVHEIKPIPKPDLQITNVYPSPTNQTITIEYSLEDKDAAMINIVNLVGQKIYSMPINYQHKGVYKTTIDVSNYNDGIYFVTLNTRTRVSQKKFIKLNWDENKENNISMLSSFNFGKTDLLSELANI